jgi:hypothetical protein
MSRTVDVERDRILSSIHPQTPVTYESNAAPCLVDQTAAIEHVPLPIPRRISLPYDEFGVPVRHVLSVFPILGIPFSELPINDPNNLAVAHDETRDVLLTRRSWQARSKTRSRPPTWDKLTHKTLHG